MTDPISSERVDAQAIAWIVRVNDPAFAEWDAFAQWLAESPLHADAYHAAAAAEADAVALLAAAPPAAVSIAPTRRRWQPWLGGAIAASLVALIGVQMHRPAPPPRIYQTAPGIHRTIALYGQRETWATMQRAGMRADFSWRQSAARYAALYHSLLQERTPA